MKQQIEARFQVEAFARCAVCRQAFQVAADSIPVDLARVQSSTLELAALLVKWAEGHTCETKAG